MNSIDHRYQKKTIAAKGVGIEKGNLVVSSD